MVSLADFLQGEYGIPLAAAIWAYPLPAALALWPAAVRRHGGEARGPDAGDRAAGRAMQRAKAWLAERFDILPRGEPGPANALRDYLRKEAAHGR
jgi:hypothetical protein